MKKQIYILKIIFNGGVIMGTDKNGNKRKATEVIVSKASFTGERKNDGYSEF